MNLNKNKPYSTYNSCAGSSLEWQELPNESHYTLLWHMTFKRYALTILMVKLKAKSSQLIKILCLFEWVYGSPPHTQSYIWLTTQSPSLKSPGYRESLNRDKSSVMGKIESYRDHFLDIFRIIISNRDRLRNMWNYQDHLEIA